MASVITTTTILSNLVQTVFDTRVKFALMNIPMHRDIADVVPDSVPMKGSAVVFARYPDMTPTTTTLTEDVDPDSVALPNPTQLTLTPGEYGMSTILSKQAVLKAFSETKSDAIEIVARHQANSIDRIFRTAVNAGTNVKRS